MSSSSEGQSSCDGSAATDSNSCCNDSADTDTASEEEVAEEEEESAGDSSKADEDEGDESMSSEDGSSSGFEPNSGQRGLLAKTPATTKSTLATTGKPESGEDALEHETWSEHLRKYGKNHKCPRCRWMRNREAWRMQLTYTDRDGKTGVWVEERCEPGHPWGLGCKVCRWAGSQSLFGRGDVRRDRGTTLTSLRRHGNHGLGGMRVTREHANALAKLLDNTDSDEAHPGHGGERADVPSFAMLYTAYKGAKAGCSFSSYTRDLEVSRCSGANIPKSRSSRHVAKRIVECCAEELQSGDRSLLAACTDIALTMDGRRSMLAVQARLTMGNGLPTGLRPVSHGGQAPGWPGRDAYGEVTRLSGVGIHTVDMLLSLRQQRGLDGTVQLAEHLVDSLRSACGGPGEVWEHARNVVRVFCPDGAPDEQLAGRLAAEEFPNLHFVIRCAAHGVQVAVRAAWGVDPEVFSATCNAASGHPK